jgi:hypothetical protein
MPVAFAARTFSHQIVGRMPLHMFMGRGQAMKLFTANDKFTYLALNVSADWIE